MSGETVIDLLLTATDFPDDPTLEEASRLIEEAGGSTKSLRDLLSRRGKLTQPKATEALVRPIRPPLELFIGEGGAIYSASEQRAEQARWQVQRRSLEAKHAAQLAERTPEVEAKREHDAARAAELRRLAPRGVPT